MLSHQLLALLCFWALFCCRRCALGRKSMFVVLLHTQAEFVPSSPCRPPALCQARWTLEGAAAPRWSPSRNVSNFSTPSSLGRRYFSLWPSASQTCGCAWCVRKAFARILVFSGFDCGVSQFVAVTVTISSMLMFLCLQVPTNPIARQVSYLFVGVCLSLCPTVGLVAHLLLLSFWSRCFIKKSIVCISPCMPCLITEVGLVNMLLYAALARLWLMSTEVFISLFFIFCPLSTTNVDIFRSDGPVVSKLFDKSKVHVGHNCFCFTIKSEKI